MRLKTILGTFLVLLLSSFSCPLPAAATPNVSNDFFTVDLDSSDNFLDVLANDTGSGVLAISKCDISSTWNA